MKDPVDRSRNLWQLSNECKQLGVELRLIREDDRILDPTLVEDFDRTYWAKGDGAPEAWNQAIENLAASIQKKADQREDDSSLENIFWSAILAFSFNRFRAISRQAIHRLQRIEASRIFADDYRHKTLWDEYCHETQYGPTMLEDAFRSTLFSIVDRLVEALPVEEKAILTLSDPNYDGRDYDESKPDINPEYISREILTYLSEAAGDRDMSRFDPSL